MQMIISTVLMTPVRQTLGTASVPRNCQNCVLVCTVNAEEVQGKELLLASDS